jgi:hypothetical protein
MPLNGYTRGALSKAVIGLGPRAVRSDGRAPVGTDADTGCDPCLRVVILFACQWDKLIDAGQPIEMTTWAERFTFDVVNRVAFSTHTGAIQTGK